MLVPDAADRRIVHDVIYDELCLGGSSRRARARSTGGSWRELVEDGAQGILLGCTEIDLLVGAEDVVVPVYDTTRLHAERAVELSVG